MYSYILIAMTKSILKILLQTNACKLDINLNVYVLLKSQQKMSKLLSFNNNELWCI
jgi:hypothetical protein